MEVAMEPTKSFLHMSFQDFVALLQNLTIKDTAHDTSSKPDELAFTKNCSIMSTQFDLKTVNGCNFHFTTDLTRLASPDEWIKGYENMEYDEHTNLFMKCDGCGLFVSINIFNFFDKPDERRYVVNAYDFGRYDIVGTAIKEAFRLNFQERTNALLQESNKSITTINDAMRR